MCPPVPDDGLRRNLSEIGCPCGEMAMAPNYKHQVWKDPDASDDDVVVPALAGDSSDDELGMDDEGHAVYIAQANDLTLMMNLGSTIGMAQIARTAEPVGEKWRGCSALRPHRGILWHGPSTPAAAPWM